MKANPTTRIFWAVAVAVVLIALGSFSLSFLVLKDLATKNGVPAHLAFIWPLIVDVSVIVFTAAILVSQLQRRGAKLAIGLTGFYAIVTIIGNVLHAPLTWLGWFVAILPPLSLIFATEMLRAMAHHNILLHGDVTTLAELNTAIDAARTELNTKEAELNTLAGELEQLKVGKAALNFEETTPKFNTELTTLNAARLDAKQDRLNTLVDYLADNPQATLTEAAAVVDVSRQTVGKYVNELTEAGTLRRNGSGWEVTP